jgi:class 3 adenylate cyclase/pimeloyl-ACP methyl ester carboxylesterase
MEPRIQFVKTSDGVRIAISTLGDGPAVVMIPFWFSFMPAERQLPPARAFFACVFPNRLQVYYDKRGMGLSDRDPPDFSLDALLSDLEAVTDFLGLSEFVLFGPGDGACIAIAYAARHPERVSHMILWGAYCSLEGRTGLLDALAALMSVEWNLAAQAIAELANPSVDLEAKNAIASVIRSAATSKDAVSMLRHAVAFDVRPFLTQIQTPTLIMHRRGDRVVPFEAGRELAAVVPTARFVPLDGDCHTFAFGDIAPIADAVAAFLPTPEAKRQQQRPATGPITVFFTDVEGSTALTQRLGDAKARDVLRTHERIVRDALRAHQGSEVKTMGDGFMASFPSATRALECAIALQRAFAEHNAALVRQAQDAHTEPFEVRIRVGLNAGEPIAEEEDLFGTAVILAARIAAKAEGGEILVANVIRELAAGKGFLFSDRGETALRGFEDPVRLYEVRWREG